MVLAANYTGVVFDVEQVAGSASVIVPAFQKTFAAAKRVGLKVAVTTSHSAPYQVDSPDVAPALVKSWAADANVDILSPQLYSSGTEAAPQFATTSSCPECTWELYKDFKGQFAPSIVGPEQLDAVATFFSSNFSIGVQGYFQWRQ